MGVLTGARDDEAGMISGASATGATAATGIAHAFLIAGHVALATALAATILLPAANTFLTKLRLPAGPWPLTEQT